MKAGNENARLSLAAVLLNRPRSERDYSRAFYNLYILVAAKRPEAVPVLEEICRDAALQKPVRNRAALLLSVAKQAMPNVAEPALAQMVASHVLKRDGARYMLAD